MKKVYTFFPRYLKAQLRCFSPYGNMFTVFGSGSISDSMKTRDPKPFKTFQPL